MNNLFLSVSLLFIAGNSMAQTQFNKQPENPEVTLQNTFDSATDSISAKDLDKKSCIMFDGSFRDVIIKIQSLQTNVNRGPLFPVQTKNIPWITSVVGPDNDHFDKVEFTETNSEFMSKFSYNVNNIYILNLRKAGDLVVFKFSYSNKASYGYCWKK